jgi:hypothetical protein
VYAGYAAMVWGGLDLGLLVGKGNSEVLFLPSRPQMQVLADVARLGRSRARLFCIPRIGRISGSLECQARLRRCMAKDGGVGLGSLSIPALCYGVDKTQGSGPSPSVWISEETSWHPESLLVLCNRCQPPAATHFGSESDISGTRLQLCKPGRTRCCESYMDGIVTCYRVPTLS